MIYGKTNNRFMSAQLFLESSTLALREEYPPLWTLKRHDYKGLPSAYNTFMSCVDEYEGAIKICGSMKNWRILNSAKWFREGAYEYGHEGSETWVADMKKRDASMAMNILQQEARDGNVTAAKALIAESKKTATRTKKSKHSPNNGLSADIREFKKGLTNG